MTLNGKVLGSHNSRSKNSSVVMCVWNPLLSSAGNDQERPVRIDFFAKHSVNIEQKSLTHLLFSGSWFKHHPNQLSLGPPITVWEYDLFDSSVISNLIPVQFIKSRTISIVDTLSTTGHALFLIPCIDK